MNRGALRLMTMEATPTLYGKYQLIEPLARGGMAEVFKAKARGVEGFEKTLVIKRILPEFSQNPRFIEMFINEAKIAVTLSHANIVQVFDLGQAQDTYFIAMEFVAGMDLATMLRLAQRQKQRGSPEIAVYLVSELAKGLDYAHRRRDSEQRLLNLVHRDVSPHNVLLSHEGEVKLTDFGIAKARTLAQGVHGVTEVGVIKGKYAYVAPEQVRGKTIDARADVFAAGVLLYEVLTGENPFYTASNYDTLERIRTGTFAPIQERRHDVPPAVAGIVHKAMAIEPEQRYQSASALYEDLIQFLYGSGRRVGARDLADFLAMLRSAAIVEDMVRTATGELRAPRAVDAVGVDSNDGSADRTEHTGVERQRRRDTPYRRLSETPVDTAARLELDQADHARVERARSELLDVTALALRLPGEDGLSAQCVQRMVLRMGGSSALTPTTAGAESEHTFVFLFGADKPDGHDAQQAALCALRISQAAGAGASGVKLGIVAGRVLADLSGVLSRDALHTDLIERAKGLMMHSARGQILVSADAEKGMRDHFKLSVFEARQEGGVGQGMFVLLGERNPAEVYGRFIGRRAELKLIGESLARASRGELRVLEIQGQAGTGKTRLLVETGRRLSRAGHDVGLYVAQLTPQLRDMPLGAIQSMLRAVLGVDEFEAPALVQARRAQLHELGLIAPERDAVATLISAALGAETGKRTAGTRPLRAALLRIVRMLAQERLTIFAWDGAEHMDAESQRIVEDMLETGAQARVGVLFMVRPPYCARWTELPNFAHIELGPLSDDDISRLIATRLGADEIPIELLREVTLKSGGNPLYAEEHLKALSDVGAIRFEAGQVRFEPDVTNIEVPKTLRGSVASRIARLGPVPRYLLQVAAIAAERWPSELVAAAAEEDPSVVSAAVQASDMLGILQRVGPDEYAFAHSVVRQVVLEGTTPQAHKEIHAAIADAIERVFPDQLDELAERLARHREAAGQRDAAVDAFMDAARYFEARGALDKAIQSLVHALEIVGASGEASQAQERMFQLYDELVGLCLRKRDFAQGKELVERALALAEQHRTEPYIARFSVWRGKLLVRESKLEEGKPWLVRGRGLAQTLGDAELTRDAFLAEADAAADSGDYASAVALLKEALGQARERDDRRAQLQCSMQLALTYARMEEPSSALAALEELKPLAAAEHDAATDAQVLRLESQLHHYARNPEAAARAAAKAMEVAREANLFYETARSAHDLGEAFLRLGDHRRAFAALRNSYELATEHAYTRLQMANMRVLGFIDAVRFSSAEGRTRLLQAIQFAVDNGYMPDVISGKYLLAIVEQKRGDLDAARAALREVQSSAATHGDRKYAQDSERALRELDAGTPIVFSA